MHEGIKAGSGDVWIATVPNAPMVRPVKRVSLSSSQFSEAFLVMTHPCLLKNQIMLPVKLYPKCSFNCKLSLCTTIYEVVIIIGASLSEPHINGNALHD